jgi:hypothetical protein
MIGGLHGRREKRQFLAVFLPRKREQDSRRYLRFLLLDRCHGQQSRRTSRFGVCSCLPGDERPTVASEDGVLARRKSALQGPRTCGGNLSNPMAISLEDALLSVWQQVLDEKVRTVNVNGGSYPVRRTSRSKLREVDFKFGDTALRGVEQNPTTKSRWAKLAREGKKVMQFIENGRFVANVVDGKVTVYHAGPERGA